MRYFPSFGLQEWVPVLGDLHGESYLSGVMTFQEGHSQPVVVQLGEGDKY